MLYTATSDTLLKKYPVQGSTLPGDQKVYVCKGTQYTVKRVFDSDGLHALLELEAGDWWIFLPHWTTYRVTAVFNLERKRSQQLIYGSLAFYDWGKMILTVVATSGLAGYQYAGAETVRGKGCLPPYDQYMINTNGYYLSTTGVDGMFYHITPDPIEVRGVKRSELGLHRDANYANAPGSAGCIVFNDSDTFTDKLIAEAKEIQSYIPLSVIYS